MIINKQGEIIPALRADDGIIVKDTYKDTEFSIALYYDEQSRQYNIEKRQCKKALAASDYKATKYSEGCYTEEEYEPIRVERQGYRDRINELEKLIVIPTISLEDMREAEEKALRDLASGMYQIIY